MLAARDVGAVYRLLKQDGVTQREIARRTGQSQSEVSEITQGRQVRDVAVLERIADGLGVPRAIARRRAHEQGYEQHRFTCDSLLYPVRNPVASPTIRLCQGSGS